LASQQPPPAKAPKHVEWLIDIGELQTAEGKRVSLMEFRHQKDEAILSEWARHFRNQYCLDSQIDLLRDGTKLSRSEYLTKIKFPDAKKACAGRVHPGHAAALSSHV
jgi:hypothetical protein